MTRRIRTIKNRLDDIEKKIDSLKNRDLADLIALSIAFIAILMSVLLFAYSQYSQYSQFIDKRTLVSSAILAIFLLSAGACIMLYLLLKPLQIKREFKIVILIFVILLFFYRVTPTIYFLLNPPHAITYTLQKEIPQNEINVSGLERIIIQYDDTVNYNLNISVNKAVEYANLKIKFESPLIIENGKEIRFYYNPSDSFNNKTIQTYSLTFNKAGGVDYVYIFANISGVAKAKEKNGRISIEAKVSQKY